MPSVRFAGKTINLPGNRPLRIGLGVLFTLFGFVGFLPILGFWGQEDLFCPVSGAHKVLAACPQTAFYLYGGVGHWVMIERAAEFNRHLLHFLAD